MRMLEWARIIYDTGAPERAYQRVKSTGGCPSVRTYNTVTVRVVGMYVWRGLRTEQADAAGRVPEASSAPTARRLELQPGDDYGAAAAALVQKGWGDAYVVHVGARSLELLCESMGASAANAEFNTLMHRVLGIAEQVRYCDRAANPRWNGRQDSFTNPINCTWGFTRPPPLPEAALFGMGGGELPKCETDPAALLRSRLEGPTRTFSGTANSRYSTRDRAQTLFRQYM